MRVNFCSIFGIPSLLILFAGCGTSPIKYYPNFPSRKDSLGEIVLLGDVFLAEGTINDTSKLDAVWNREMGDSLLLYISTELEKRNYPVTRSRIASVGMPVGRRSVYSVASSAEEQQLAAALLPKGRPPFYLDVDFDTTAGRKRQWMNICRALIQSPFEPEVSRTIIEDASALGEYLKAKTICIFFATGFTVPVSQRLIEKRSSTNQPIGLVADERISQASVTLYIIDVGSGELLWSDQSILRGGTVYLGKLTVLCDRILDHLP